MATFIKTGFWEKDKKGYNGWLNLEKLIAKVSPPSTLSYKIYTALLTQTGTDAPVATILENTLGNIVWSRNFTGQYIGTLVGAFTTDKTISPQFPAFKFEGNGTFLPISVNANPQLGWVNMYWQSTDVISLDTFDMIGNAEWSTILGSTLLIEIRVYN